MSARTRPKGDSFGSLGETVAPIRLRARRLRGRQERQRALLVVTAALLAVVADLAAMSLCLAAVQHDLGLPPASLPWLVAAALLPFGLLPLVSSELSLMLGTRRLAVLGGALYVASGAATVLAGSLGELLLARLVAGCGAALIVSIALPLTLALFPRPKEQRFALAFHGLASVAAPALGVLVAAAALAAGSWRWMLLPAPIAALVLAALAPRLIDDDRGERVRQPITAWVMLPAGAGLLGATAVALAAASLGWIPTTAGAAVTLLTAVVSAGIALGVRRTWSRRAEAHAEPTATDRRLHVASVALLAVGGGQIVTVVYVATRLVAKVAASEMGAGLTLLAMTIAGALSTMALAPRMLAAARASTVLTGSLALQGSALACIGWLDASAPGVGSLVLPVILVGIAAGLGLPAAQRVGIGTSPATEHGARTSWMQSAQYLGGAIALAVWGGADAAADAVAGAGTGSALGLLGTAASAVTAAAVVWLGLASERRRAAAGAFDPEAEGAQAVPVPAVDGPERVDADMVALGLGGTSMMSMLWTIAMGRRAVGVELRGSPTFSVMHWNIREDLFHHLAYIDQLMLERYGIERIPRRGDGEPFLLQECFYSTRPGSTGDARADEVITGFIPDSHIAGLVASTEQVDDRFVDGEPQRSVTQLGAATPPGKPDASRIGRSIEEMLLEPSTFQVGAQELLVLLRRYLTTMERMDREMGLEPRCRIYQYHRVVPPLAERLDPVDSSYADGGFVREPDGRVRLVIEPIQELEAKGVFQRRRRLGASVIDLGTPELFVIAQGADSSDAARLGFEQRVFTIDHGDGRGRLPAQADYLVGLMTMYVGSRCRRRIASEFDRDGAEYWVRQATIGHEEDGEVGWIVVEVPDFCRFDPITTGLVPADTARDSSEYFAGYQHLVREYFLDQTATITEIPRKDIGRISIARRPTLFSVTLRAGVDAQVAQNGVVAGDSFGNGTYLTSGGINTGAVGHGSRVLRYWKSRDAGVQQDQAIRQLADGIKSDTEAWVHVSLPDLSQPRDPGGRCPSEREAILEATRRHRATLAPMDRRDDWSRIHVFVGRLYTYEMPELHPVPPAQRRDTGESRSPEILSRLPRVENEDEGASHGRFGHRRGARDRPGDEERAAP